MLVMRSAMRFCVVCPFSHKSCSERQETVVEQHGPILQLAAYPKHALLDSDRGNVQPVHSLNCLSLQVLMNNACPMCGSITVSQKHFEGHYVTLWCSETCGAWLESPKIGLDVTLLPSDDPRHTVY